MKKIVGLAVLAVGMLVGANSALAYPPQPVPTISSPQTVGPGETFSIVVSNAAVGDTITATFQGETKTAVVAAGSGLTPVATGSASLSFMAPNAAGSYPLTAQTSSGYKLSTTITVAKANPPVDKKPGGGGSNTKLPATGSDILLPGISLGLAALAGGLGLLFVSKRRRNAAA